RRLRSGSPAKAFTPRAGNRPGLKYSAACLPGGAALTGLQVPRHLRSGSPDRRAAPPPGRCRGDASAWLLPGSRCA
ncbi:hypothetical protein, partial [Klebsiella michiganensis]|uniref:hypothetical protein n=1 Tax=Klebsiella michiganensis TaxID=1134687 RepID=UPI0039B633DD